ncbi:MAG: hypothetical protein KF726_08355 [Anaerolineae bacterium]|nr:hypothetical protein [Anaerolineae bacterium]
MPAESSELERYQRICAEWLDNASLFDLILSPDGSITMKLIVGGTDDTDYWLDIECSGVHSFDFRKHWEDRLNYDDPLILGATIEKFDAPEAVRALVAEVGFYASLSGKNLYPQQFYRLRLEGSIGLEVICVELQMIERHESNGSGRNELT